MPSLPAKCPNCKIEKSVKIVTSSTGRQRYQCKNINCSKNTFSLEYSGNGYLPEVKQKIIDMALNGRGIRDTARVLKISMNTVMSTIKKSANS